MRVYVHGNCQAPIMAGMIGEQFPDWDIRSYEVFGQPIIDDIAAYHDAVGTADIIISQPIHDGYRDRDDLSLNWLRSAAKPGAKLVVYPSMFFDGQLVGWRSVATPGYGMLYHDMLLFHCAAIGLSVERTTALLLDAELYSDDFIAREIALSLAEMRRREAVDNIDVAISPFLTRYAEAAQLFHIINHPCRPAFAYQANAILAHLGYPDAVPYAGAEGLPYPHVPLSRSVARFLARRGAGAEPGWGVPDGHCYHLPAMPRLTPAEYCGRAVEQLRSYPRETLFAHLREPHVAQFLARVAEANPTFPGIGMHKAA